MITFFFFHVISAIINVPFIGIKAQINCTRLELETSSKTPTTKSTISISRTTNISPTSTIYTTDNSSASLITASINKGVFISPLVMVNILVYVKLYILSNL